MREILTRCAYYVFVAAILFWTLVGLMAIVAASNAGVIGFAIVLVIIGSLAVYMIVFNDAPTFSEDDSTQYSMIGGAIFLIGVVVFIFVMSAMSGE